MKLETQPHALCVEAALPSCIFQLLQLKISQVLIPQVWSITLLCRAGPSRHGCKFTQKRRKCKTFGREISGRYTKIVFCRDLLYVCPILCGIADIHEVSPYDKSDGKRCRRHQIGVASIQPCRRYGEMGGKTVAVMGVPLGMRQYARNVAYLKARLFFCIITPAIQPYLRHGCMAGYSYHAPLGHSHLTLAYKKAQIVVLVVQVVVNIPAGAFSPDARIRDGTDKLS